ncbi:FadR family transcriptional regulator (plasmid) [Rhodococcus pseudokoreensis]|uniref:FadR family transcriptional regulator n=1 Tax=Rhodococcus pseudokoreensis TaxID=2811421 RepID=A0A974ZRC6_9NOCA|nr:FadR family transcriptional regulator [Rhodococcus pseudokoreensis]
MHIEPTRTKASQPLSPCRPWHQNPLRIATLDPRPRKQWRSSLSCSKLSIVHAQSKTTVSPDSSPRRSRAEVVAGQLEDEILGGHLAVGTHLGRRAELMDRFGISPTIANEALRILRDSGLVSVRPGNRGGIFVASQPPQIRLGATDFWFTEGGPAPGDLFEARVHLETVLTPIAFDRATTEDVTSMRTELSRMERAVDPCDFFVAVMQVHRTMVTAARVPVLDSMHQAIVALLTARLTRAVFVPGYEEVLRHSVFVHVAMVDAIAERNREAFDKAIVLHSADLVREGKRACE